MWRVILFVLCIAGLPLSSSATDYYVNSQQGNDTKNGITPAAAWQSLKKVNDTSFKPGDRILFCKNSTWQGQLLIQSQGKAGKPVIYTAYGKGARPKIEGVSPYQDAIQIHNAQYTAIRGFEVTHHGEGEVTRRGVHIVADNCGTMNDISVMEMVIHDVNGTQKEKNNGGIIFTTNGDRVPTRFDGLRIEKNIVWKVDRSGIAAQSYHWKRTAWFPSLHVVIRDNWVGDIGGDGIVPWATDGVLVEHNILQGANERAKSYNAGIWPWSTDNSLFRLNHASGVKTRLDGQGFDSDYNSRNTIFEYNVSNDNEGGFMLICNPGKEVSKDNLGNIGTIVRYNISRNDRARIFHVSAAKQTLVHNNAIYIGPELNVPTLILTNWSGWADGLVFRNNLFYAEGRTNYGYEVKSNKDGTYTIEPGWGPAKDISFIGNRYDGYQENQPEKTNPQGGNAPKPVVEVGWPGPKFDPNQPDSFDAFLTAHHAWMMKVMEHQFGYTPPVTRQ